MRAILRRLGLGWVPRALKLWPLVGAPIGFALDRAALRALGNAALATLDELPRPAVRERRRGARASQGSARARAPLVRRRSTRKS
jgi:hypothetical protein